MSNNRHDKNLALLKQVIIPHHPMFTNATKEFKEQVLQHPGMFNCEHGVEIAMAAASKGLYEFVDGAGYDNSDSSDTKTVTVNWNTKKAEVSSIENKIGALRIVIYDPSTNSLDYMFIPAKAVNYLASPCYGKNRHKLRLIMTYSSWTGHWNRFEEFRVDSFEELARMV